MCNLFSRYLNGGSWLLLNDRIESNERISFLLGIVFVFIIIVVVCIKLK